MTEPHSDALVLFGATGDPAREQVFPAPHAMERRGHLDVPVIGVAEQGWTLEQLCLGASLPSRPRPGQSETGQ